MNESTGSFVVAKYNELVVTQSNSLVESAHSLTLNEKRVLMLGISQLDSRKPDRRAGEVVIYAEEFAGIFNMPLRHCYEVLKEGTAKLYNRDIRKFIANGRVTKHQRWLEAVAYQEGAGCVSMTFTQGVMPLLTLLHREFTSFQLKQIGGLSSFYAIRFYELLIQFKKTGQRVITVERLRDILDVGDKYAKLADLRRYVIEPSLDDINQNTDLEAEMKLISKGRKVVAYQFNMEVVERSGEEPESVMPQVNRVGHP